jgi:hypothetical protein
MQLQHSMQWIHRDTSKKMPLRMHSEEALCDLSVEAFRHIRVHEDRHTSDYDREKSQCSCQMMSDGRASFRGAKTSIARSLRSLTRISAHGAIERGARSSANDALLPLRWKGWRARRPEDIFRQSPADFRGGPAPLLVPINRPVHRAEKSQPEK